jgi:hypothetical protein
MNEKIPNEIEAGAEKMPTREEIKQIFENTLLGKEYKEVRFEEDEKGVVIYEIETTDEVGDKLVFNYLRAKYDYKVKKVAPGAQNSASIHVVKYNAEGIPRSGEDVANYRDGEWRVEDGYVE